MAGYVQKATRTGGSDLPAELPNAVEEVGKGVPNGAIFETSDGRRYRLRHPETTGARWQEVHKREAKAGKK